MELKLLNYIHFDLIKDNWENHIPQGSEIYWTFENY
jgi:hypothetical protein